MNRSETDNQYHYDFTIDFEKSTMRLDKALSDLLPQHSRAQIQQWIKSGFVTLNQTIPKANQKLATDDYIQISAPFEAVITAKPQAMDLDIVHEDDAIIIINKPSGLTVHPGAGTPDNTLMNALLYHHPALERLPRAGIIHRLDKQTTGLMVIPKTEAYFHDLSQKLRDRTITRRYKALVLGSMISGTTIDKPIGRHPKNRLKMAVIDTGKHACTQVRIDRKYQHYTLLNCELETGRTHQIRVHCQWLGYPIVGDPLYATQHSLTKGLPLELRDTIMAFKRQALHAYQLQFTHPETQEHVIYEAPLPSDFNALMTQLEHYDAPFSRID